jgi:hypothetical protein
VIDNVPTIGTLPAAVMVWLAWDKPSEAKNPDPPKAERVSAACVTESVPDTDDLPAADTVLAA